MFLLSNLRRAGIDEPDKRDDPRSGVYVGAFEAGELVGVACHYRMGNLLVNAPEHAVALAGAALQASARPLAGVVGPAAQVQAIASALGLPVGDAAKFDDAEGLYRLALSELQIPADLQRGLVRGRALARADLEQVLAWTIRYRVEEVGDLESPELEQRVAAELEASLDRGNVWVLERDGELVARTGFNAELPEAVQIGGVWTPHALRRRGFARCAVASQLLAAREAGVRVAILFTSDTNLPARRAYAALGFERVGAYRLLLLREPLQLEQRV